MRFSHLFFAAVVAAAPVAAPAAITVFAVNGIFTAGNPSVAAGTLTGTFSIDFGVSPTKITALNLVSSASGNFVSVSYSDPASVVTNQDASNNFRLSISSGSQILQLVFSPALTATSGSAIGSNSYETQTAKNPSNRFLTGTATVAAAPEPAAWAMMVMGFGLIGASIRYGRRRTAITFA